MRIGSNGEVVVPCATDRSIGITNGDGLLTSDGRDIFLTWLLKNNPNFKTEVVDAILADQKEQKTCS